MTILDFMQLKWLEPTTRHGAQGALLAVSFLFEMVTPSIAGDIFCGIVPWGCTVQAAEQKREPERYNVTLIYFSPFGKPAKKKECTCHFDYVLPGYSVEPATIHHVANSEACWKDENKWIHPWHDIRDSNKRRNIEELVLYEPATRHKIALTDGTYRMHCTTDDDGIATATQVRWEELSK